MINYEYKNQRFLKQGRAMFNEDILNDLQRLAYLENQLKENDKNASNTAETLKDDELLQAAKTCVIVGYASTSLLVRKFKTTYTTAMYLLAALENNKIIGPFNGSENRAVLINLQELKKLAGRDLF